MRLKNQLPNGLIAVVAVLCLVGCDAQVPQEIVGTLAVGDQPAANQDLWLYPAETCEGAAIQARTDASGTFRFSTESTRGGIGVVTQSLSLCIGDGAVREKLWSSTHGGGAGRITLTCYLAPADRKGCSDAFRYGDKDA